MLILNKALLPKRKRRLNRVPKQRHPSFAEVKYYKLLVQEINRATDLLDQELSPLLDMMVPMRNDAAAWVGGDGGTLGFMKLVETTFGEIRVAYYKKEIESVWEQRAGEIARDVEGFNEKEIVRQFQSVLGVSPFAYQPWLNDAMKAFTTENVSLIKSLPDKYFSEIEAIVTQGVKSGARHEEIAQQIKERYGATKKRASLIARDQVSKFNGDLTHYRQINLGLTRYIWRTSLDERVRSSHAALEGTIQSWEEAPIVDSKKGRRAHPGGDFQCRCTAEPILDDILGTQGDSTVNESKKQEAEEPREIGAEPKEQARDLLQKI